MRHDFEPFLRAVIAAPADDLPRLIAADWCDENGMSEHAELIRVQTTLMREPWDCPGCTEAHAYCNDGCPWCDLHRRLCGRQQAILSSDEFLGGCGWHALAGPAAKLVPKDGNPPEHLHFQRGFVGGVTTTLSLFLAHGPDIVGCQPVERVTLSDRQPHMQANRFVVWWRVRYGLATDADDLPPEIHDHLSGNRTTAATIYRSEPEAFADLSAATIAWARAEHNRRLAAAGLLPVPWGAVREGVGA
jgi:uncharacterized protein (TIGR02996 family)